MKVYIVVTIRGIVNLRREFHGIYLTAEEAKACAQKYQKNYDSIVMVYELENPRKSETGALFAIDSYEF